MTDTIDILHMSKKDRKKKSITAIKNGIVLDDEINELAWAVIKQAILDIGWTEKTKKTRFNGTIYYCVDRSNDSRHNIKQGGLTFWLEILGVEQGFLNKILRHYKLI